MTKEAKSVSTEIQGADDKLFTLEAGRMANLAGGSVIATMGRTQVLVTATGAKQARENASFFPLTVDVEERMYAAGKIPGSFFRREGRASEQAILVCRLLDRPLRPNFPDGFRNEVHVIATVLAADQANQYDVLALNAASAALMLSDIPFDGPVGAVRLGYSTDGEWIPFPTYEEGQEGTFEIVVAGRETSTGDIAISMVEAGGVAGSIPKYEAGAPKVNETVLGEGLEASKAWIRQAIDLQHELVTSFGAKPKMDYSVTADTTDEVYEAVAAIATDRVKEAMTIADKMERQAAEGAIKSAVREELSDHDGDLIGGALRKLTKKVVRDRVLNEGIRMDGRGPADLRELKSEIGVVATGHGSGLFQRGDTQVLNVTTLGTGRMDQMIDGIDPVSRKRYMHHYNFPPYCTGETGFMRGPKRREIGHGALAERALVPVIPDFEDFPYTYRLVSEVMASNGSSSMASVCGSSLSLMDAGVPIAAPVAGIAMGLIHEDGKYIPITDILGAEDAMGDMDFKVCGTADFVTALQMDTKIDGIPADVLAAALQQALDARMQVLANMAEAIAEPRSEVNENAPQIVSFEIPIDKIGEIIGPKGKVINAMQAETGADISVDDDGMVGVVSIASADRNAVAEAERQVKLILDPPTPEMGATYTGRVVNITNFGAFVNIMPGRDGLVHISKIGGKRRIDKVEDELSLGDTIEVIVEDIDPNGKISLMPAEFADELTSGGGDDSGESSGNGRGDRGGRSREGGGGRDRDSGGGRGGRDRGARGGRDRDGGGRDGGGRGGRDRDSGGGRSDRPKKAAGDVEVVSFNEAFDAEQSDRYKD
ncbi:polyribonucleotide nucleotidyltransferase [Acidimicrobiales bacterium]|nr:polyribonucleotide nucleotidyltransferase [bacterium]MDC3299937.1 polyribonucleotide nucleotidyltransferase [Acidimicrobiales bacterium]